MGKDHEAGTSKLGHASLLGGKSIFDADRVVAQVLMGARVMAANRLAVDGKTWSEIFTARNSGTGNKQWLVLNSNNVSTEFWVVEQLPDFTCSEDMTQELLSKGYWVSSSYPYHPVSTLKQSFG